METVGRYELIELLGQGAMGRVYLGMDPKLRREVAIKVLHEHIATDEHRRRLFHREARAAAALDHPNVMKVYDYSGPDEPVQYIVLQRLRGVDLGTVLDSLRQLPETIVLAMAYEVALALEHAHDNGLVHRDLKPDNLFLEPDGRVVLGDFGIAKAMGEGGLGQTMVVEQSKLMGTPLYMAPEQLKFARSSPASDVFSLGSVMFHLLAGAPPFAGRGQELLERIADGKVRFLRTIDPTISVEGAALVHSLLSPDETARPSCAELRKQVRQVLDHLGISDTRMFLQRCFYEPEQVGEEERQKQMERFKATPAAPPPNDATAITSIATVTGVSTVPATTSISSAPLRLARPAPLRPRVVRLAVSVVLGVFAGLLLSRLWP